MLSIANRPEQRADFGRLVRLTIATAMPLPEAANVLFTLPCDELRQTASARLRRESPGHTLSATALAHEAWFSLASQTRTRWTSRSHFFAIASTPVRRILADHARGKQADKRDAVLLTLTEAHGLLDGAKEPGSVRVH